MTALSRRLRRLEYRFAPPDDSEGRRRLELLESRIRQRAEEKGETYVPRPYEDISGMSIVEVLRMGYKRTEVGDHPRTK